MDILNYVTDTKFKNANKINDSKFLQKNVIKKSLNINENISSNIYNYYSSFDELIISILEPDYYLNEDKDLFYNKLKMIIASKLDENKSEYYDKFNYSKFFNISLIQSGLQENNKLSTLIYLSNYYNINIYIQYNVGIINTYYNFLDKNKTNYYIIFDSAGWILSKTDFDLNKIDIQSMNKFIKDSFISNNLKNKSAYNKHLEPISKYKINELINIAKKEDIELIDKKTNKNKIKQKLYDDINYKYI